MTFWVQRKRRTRRFAWTLDIKERLSEAQNHRCCWCGKRMEANGRREDYPTIEHIHPLYQGGADAIDNVAIACRGCNEGRPLYSEIAP